jgi:hypothetical protein
LDHVVRPLVASIFHHGTNDKDVDILIYRKENHVHHFFHCPPMILSFHVVDEVNDLPSKNILQ